MAWYVLALMFGTGAGMIIGGVAYAIASAQGWVGRRARGGGWILLLGIPMWFFGPFLYYCFILDPLVNRSAEGSEIIPAFNLIYGLGMVLFLALGVALGWVLGAGKTIRVTPTSLPMGDDANPFQQGEPDQSPDYFNFQDGDKIIQRKND